MPRRPDGDRAQTDAERQRKRRERLRQEERGPDLTDRQKLIKARAEIERLRGLLDATTEARRDVVQFGGPGMHQPKTRMCDSSAIGTGPVALFAATWHSSSDLKPGTFVTPRGSRSRPEINTNIRTQVVAIRPICSRSR
jgi:hypothetical protein